MQQCLQYNALTTFLWPSSVWISSQSEYPTPVKVSSSHTLQAIQVLSCFLLKSATRHQQQAAQAAGMHSMGAQLSLLLLPAAACGCWSVLAALQLPRSGASSASECTVVVWWICHTFQVRS